MTLFLLLGLFAGLYAIALLFRLAIHALPVMAGIGGAFMLHGHGAGLFTAGAIGLGLGIGLFLTGQSLFAATRSPLPRFLLGATFAIPAGIAGYHAVGAVAGIVIDPGVSLSVLSWLGAAMIGASAVARLGPAPGSPPHGL